MLDVLRATLDFYYSREQWTGHAQGYKWIEANVLLDRGQRAFEAAKLLETDLKLAEIVGHIKHD